MSSLEERVRRVVHEQIEIVPYDAHWPDMFRAERDHLGSCLPGQLLGRIEHFGSTAVPGLPAKSTIDILVEVTDLEVVKATVVPLLESPRPCHPVPYDYFWRPTMGDDVPPFYAWFIKRDSTGARTHHIHMIESTPLFHNHWQALRFRDYLIAHPDAAHEYAELKTHLAAAHTNDRVAYTVGKSDFIAKIVSNLPST
jgi:GrpB-like predicted nucleotidyltransferase (UPF0157 family)